jgi:hypothetical protein
MAESRNGGFQNMSKEFQDPMKKRGNYMDSNHACNVCKGIEKRVLFGDPAVPQ